MPKSVLILRIYPVIAIVILFIFYFTQPCCIIDCASALATFYAAIVALFVSDYREYKNKPVLSIKPSNFITTVQNNTWYRLEIFNHGKGIAKNVSIKLFSKTNNNFVPIKLTWTHINKPLQDVQPNDYALCDVVIDRPNALCLCTEVTPLNGTIIFPKSNISFQMVICADNCKAQEYTLSIEYINNTLSLKIVE